jgi:hypothetical protein
VPWVEDDTSVCNPHTSASLTAAHAGCVFMYACFWPRISDSILAHQIWAGGKRYRTLAVGWEPRVAAANLPGIRIKLPLPLGTPPGRPWPGLARRSDARRKQNEVACLEPARRSTLDAVVQIKVTLAQPGQRGQRILTRATPTCHMRKE